MVAKIFFKIIEVLEDNRLQKEKWEINPGYATSEFWRPRKRTGRKEREENS